jgi:hypothetical protein
MGQQFSSYFADSSLLNIHFLNKATMGDLPDQQVSDASATGAPMQEGHTYQEHYPPATAPPAQYPSPYPPVSYPPPQKPGLVVQGSNYIQMQEGLLQFTPQVLLCPFCHETDLTRIERTFSLAGWLTCSLLFLTFLVLWFLPLCCLPCCIPSCYNVKHYCSNSNCNEFLGERRR